MSFRPPAVPLITHDPYFSVWSFNDRLTDDWARHWTGAVNAMCGMANIDGKSYRFLAPQPNEAPALTQVGLEITPTRTTYQFEGAGVHLTLTYLSPLLPDDLELISRPVTYVLTEVKALDGKVHNVTLYFDISGELVVNQPEQQITWGRYQIGEQEALRMGTQQQPVLEKAGDNLRIDWGYCYLSSKRGANVKNVISDDQTTRRGFAANGKIPNSDDMRHPRPANDIWPVMAHTCNLGAVSAHPVTHHFLIAYDDLFAIEYFNRKTRPYWRRKGAEIDEPLRKAEEELSTILERCKKFDAEITADLKRIGGDDYAQLAALAYRQAISAHKLVVDADGTLLYFSKESFSNGCIGTVDVTYPSSPLFLLLNTTLLKAQLTPLLNYAGSERWHFPFAPHDLGTYPKANGQVYGGGERTEQDQMPVEECGNMLIMVAALAKREGNADYAKHYWNTLTKWANYLKERGLDPENQLCTDDFAGHLAHNTNLSLKAIMALGGYSQMCEKLGRAEEAKEYRETAEKMAKRWVKMANDGDHYRLAFDRANTWSQKYNLVWDKLLGLNLFPADVAKKEVAYYKTKQNRYGLPLDNRKEYTKLDWIVWTATLTDNRADFKSLVEPIYRFLQESPSRVPMTDWYETVSGRQTGFQARSVVGGVYIPLLADSALWAKWHSRSK
ncbi:MAG: DUF4965 domain-containing protein [Armatimonadetes bacterium]|nr:DUF4965 domain-containing protein [Armatimonadota bacterium]